MRKTLGVALLFLLFPGCDGVEAPLPAARTAGTVSVEAALAARRSLRAFAPGALTPAEIGQLLWAAQGVTDGGRRRTAPSAGALYPLEIYVATKAGLHHYEPTRHRLVTKSTADVRRGIQAAALGQEALGAAEALFIVTGVEARTARKYGERAERYVWMEAGHAAQNLLLQATALGLGGVTIGAFHDDRVARVLSLPEGEAPLYLIPVGRRP